MRMFKRNIDLVKQILLHKIAVALVMGRRQTEIFIKIYGTHILKAEIPFLVPGR